MKHLLPLTDCDLLIHRCGFTADESEPLENHIQILDRTIDGIKYEFAQDPVMVLSGPTNFRNQVATLQPYKGNRLNSRKPIFYNELREYLIDKWDAIVTDNMEADDLLGQMQWTQPDTCIVSQDKDMKTIRGHHYNWVKKKHFKLTETDANLFLLWQVIQGDRTDNIPGLKGYGEKTATKIIRECNKDISQVKRTIKALYQKQFGNKWQSALHEVTTLLFILREPGKTYADYIGAW